MSADQPTTKDIFLEAHKRAVREMKADYQIVVETRTQAGITVPSYEEWLEAELELYRSLVKHYRDLDKGNVK